MKRFLGVQKSLEKRTIYMDGRRYPTWFPNNKINNTKYNILTLIPCVLFVQFTYFYNLFYLFITLTQLVPSLKVGN